MNPRARRTFFTLTFVGQQGPEECLGSLKHGDAVLFHSASSRIPLVT